MSQTYEDLVAEIQKLKQEKTELKQENTELKIKVENQQLHINMLNRYIFGSKSESIKKEENIVKGEQCSIFGVPEDEEVKEEIEKATETITVHRKKNTKKK